MLSVNQSPPAADGIVRTARICRQPDVLRCYRWGEIYQAIILKQTLTGSRTVTVPLTAGITTCKKFRKPGRALSAGFFLFLSPVFFLIPSLIYPNSPSSFPQFLFLTSFAQSRNGFFPPHWYFRSAVLCRKARADRRLEWRALLLFRKG